MGRNLALATVAVLLIGFAAFRFTSSAAGPQLVPATFENQHGFCMACKQDQVFSTDKGEKTPYTCSACSERAVYQWMYCRDCNKQFIPNLVYRRPDAPLPQPQPFFSCPDCGCDSYSLYSPDAPDQSVAGKAKMPKWPPAKG